MYSFYILLLLLILATVAGIFEYYRHQKRIYAIPVRIHINGTRGKSSVTRLIGAGLRAGRIPAITKVTGTFPRLILEDGTETYIHRKSDPNIIEQLSIVKFAASHNIKALVMECMALQPQFQAITEKQMIHSTLSVITNIRLDHTDVMGHTLPEIAETLGRTIPKNKHLYTAENVNPGLVKSMADKRKTTTHFIKPDVVTTTDMKGFSYIEHRENVALALAVCKHFGIDRETALNGMYKTAADAGALQSYKVDAFNKKITFYNAFAANDPDSTYLVWEKIRNEIGFEGVRIILLNTRQDRLERAKELIKMTSAKLVKETDFLFLIGQSTDVLEHFAVRNGIQKKEIINMGWTNPEKVFEKVLAVTVEASTIIAIGNMGGMGAEISEYFEHRSAKI